MTRITHVTTGLLTGGAEMMLVRLLSACNREWNPAVISLMDEGTLGSQIANLDIPIHCLHMRRRALNPIRSFRIIPVIRRLDPDLIVGWMYHGNLMAALAALFSRVRTPVFWNVQQTLYDVNKEPRLTAAVIRLGVLFSRYTAAIIYNSRLAAQQHEAFGYDSRKGVVIPAGFDCEKFHPDQDARERLLSELQLSQDAIIIGLVARYHPMKDHAGFLKAAALVANAHPQARFLLIGDGLTSQQPELLSLITELHLERHVLLLGRRSDLSRLTPGFDIACSASAWGEGFCNAVGEAMACGVPCVVTDVGDSAYAVGGTGLVAPPSDISAFAAGINQLIETGVAGRRQLGAAARQRVESEFSLPEIARRYDELYREYMPRLKGTK